jgi:hypothetical protein
MKTALLAGAMLGVALGSLACVQPVPAKIAVPPPVEPAAAEAKPVATPPAPAAPVAPAAVEAPPVVRTHGAERVLQVLGWLTQYEQNGRKADQQKVSFDFSEQAVNEYLAYALQVTPRPGIASIKVSIHRGDQITSTIAIDFDSLLRWNRDLIPVQLRPLLTGTREIRIDAQIQADKGLLEFTVKNAALLDGTAPDGTAIANSLIDDMIHLISLHQPEVYDTSRSIPLPFGLQRIWTTNSMTLAGET